MYKSKNIIVSFGIMYLMYGIIYIIYKDNIYNTNLNINLLVPMLNAITITSLLFSISDILDTCIKLKKFKYFNKELKIISNWLSTFSFAIGFSIILINSRFNEYVMTGITLITFALFIISFAIKNFEIEEKKDAIL